MLTRVTQRLSRIDELFRQPGGRRVGRINGDLLHSLLGGYCSIEH